MSSKVVTDAFTNYLIDNDASMKEIYEAVGDYKAIPCWGTEVLIAVFCRPYTTTSGLIVPIDMNREDVWQGKVGLILNKGPAAFKSNGEGPSTYGGKMPDVGDWVWHNVNSVISQLWVAGEGWKKRFFTTTRDIKTGTTKNIVVTVDGYKEAAAHQGEACRPWNGWPCRMVDDTYLHGLDRPEILI